MTELFRIIRLLKDVPLFQGLDSAGLTAVARAARYVEVRQDTFLFRQGAVADVVYVLARGRMKLTQATPDGHEALLGIAGVGELLGTMAILGERHYPVSARAIRFCQLFGWKGCVMTALMADHPQIAVNALGQLADCVQELRNRYRELATQRVERRVAEALIRLVRKAGWRTADGVLIDVPLSRQDLAEMTGTTIYSVSRILQSWARCGLVEVGRQRVAVLQSDALATIAQDLSSASLLPRQPTAHAPRLERGHLQPREALAPTHGPPRLRPATVPVR